MANISLQAQTDGTTRYYVLNSGAIDTKGQTSIQGAIREQDLTPTFKQSVEGVGSVTDTPPTAEAAWRDFSGTFGLYRQSDAPGDLTRCYVSDADTTRPGQMTAWLQWPGGSTVAIDLDVNTAAATTMCSLVNDPVSWGVASQTQSLGGGFWRWNGTKFAYQRQTQVIFSTWSLSSRLPAQSSVYSLAFGAPPVVQPTGTNLWAAIGTGSTGLSDFSVTQATPVGVANAVHTFVYFDILFVVSLTGGNILVTPYRPNTPDNAGTNILQSVTYTGLSAAKLTIPGEVCVLGVAPCEGAVYLVTDRSVYGIQWNDLLNTFISTKLLELPRITSAPVVWNGEVYIGADNRIVHIVPGQRGYDWRVPDGGGNMPAPYTGTIVQLLASPDALIAQVVDTQGATSAILRMDSDGVWSCVNYSTAIPAWPLIPVVDGTNPFGVAVANVSGGVVANLTILPLPQAGRNPRTLASTQRKQRAGPFRTITPWYDLESETAQKQLERFRTAVQGVSSTYPVKVYYQTDYADEKATDTFAAGAARTTGTWHLCGYLAASGTAYAGSTDASGNGALWWEFDGTTNYAGGAVGVLPAYPTYKRMRWCLEMNGDPTGTTVPTLLSHAFHRLEYVTKAYERDIAIRLRVGETQGKTTTSTVTYADTTAIQAALDRLIALNSGKTVCNYTNERGQVKPVVITKFSSSLTSLQGDGTPGEYVVQLSLMDMPLSGQT